MPNKRKFTKMKRGIYILPNLLTIGALFAGFFAIVSAMNGHYTSAAIAIFVAMVFDSLDGRIARLTNTVTSFGAELDSLSDMTSSGIAPALVIYTWILSGFGKLGWVAAFVYTVGVILRLARFNTQLTRKPNKRYFQGLPCPAAAGVIAGMVWTFNELGLNNKIIGISALTITVLLGILMVSNIRYHSFKDLNLKHNVSFVTILLIVLILVLIAIDPPLVLFAIFVLYAISGPILTLWQLRQRRKARTRIKGLKGFKD